MGGRGRKLLFAVNMEGLPGNNGEEGLNGDDVDLSRARLGRIMSAGGRQLLQKLNLARRNFPMKIFLLLLGFYTANALATQAIGTCSSLGSSLLPSRVSESKIALCFGE